MGDGGVVAEIGEGEGDDGEIEIFSFFDVFVVKLL